MVFNLAFVDAVTNLVIEAVARTYDCDFGIGNKKFDNTTSGDLKGVEKERSVLFLYDATIFPSIY